MALVLNNMEDRMVVFVHTRAEGGPSGTQHTVAAHLQGLSEVQVVEDEQIP